jgi:hypothetical protein
MKLEVEGTRKASLLKALVDHSRSEIVIKCRKFNIVVRL